MYTGLLSGSRPGRGLAVLHHSLMVAVAFSVAGGRVVEGVLLRRQGEGGGSKGVVGKVGWANRAAQPAAKAECSRGKRKLRQLAADGGARRALESAGQKIL